MKKNPAPPKSPEPSGRGGTWVLLAGSLAVAVALGLHLGKRGRSPEPQPATLPETSVSARSVEASLARVARPAVSEERPAPSMPAPRARPGPRITSAPVSTTASGGAADSSIVAFEVHDGLAIAFGDIVLGQPEPGFNEKRGHAEAGHPQLWETSDIPYGIAQDLPNPRRVEQAVEYFNQNTTVHFIPYQGQADAIIFQVGAEHCYSSLGKIGGLQPIHLSARCGPTEIMHELMHALGFIHEQSRTDRDQYIEILWGNIDEKYRPQFEMMPDAYMEAERGTPFDFHSAMMYRPDIFGAKPGAPTMKAVGQEAIAPVQGGLSDGDLYRLRRVYRR